MSRLTRTTNLYPAGTLIVGCTFRLRRVISAPGFAEFLTDGASGGLSWGRIGESALVGSLRDIERGGEHAGKHGKSQKATIMVVYLVPEPGVAMGIEPHHTVEIDRGSVGVDDAAPGDLHAVLTVGNSRVVPPDQTRSLRDQKVEARRRVVDIRSHQRLQLSRKIRVERLFENRRDLPARFDFVAGQWSFPTGSKIVIFVPITACREKCFFTRLHVLAVIVVFETSPISRSR